MNAEKPVSLNITDCLGSRHKDWTLQRWGQLNHIFSFISATDISLVQIRGRVLRIRTQNDIYKSYRSASSLTAMVASDDLQFFQFYIILLWLNPGFLSYFPSKELLDFLVMGSITCFYFLMTALAPLALGSFLYSYKIRCPYKNFIFTDTSSPAWTRNS